MTPGGWLGGGGGGEGERKGGVVSRSNEISIQE